MSLRWQVLQAEPWVRTGGRRRQRRVAVLQMHLAISAEAMRLSIPTDLRRRRLGRPELGHLMRECASSRKEALLTLQQVGMVMLRDLHIELCRHSSWQRMPKPKEISVMVRMRSVAWEQPR